MVFLTCLLLLLFSLVFFIFIEWGWLVLLTILALIVYKIIRKDLDKRNK